MFLLIQVSVENSVLKFTKNSPKIIACTLGLVLCTVRNILINELARSRVIIFHVFITAITTTAAANDDIIEILTNTH